MTASRHPSLSLDRCDEPTNQTTRIDSSNEKHGRRITRFTKMRLNSIYLYNFPPSQIWLGVILFRQVMQNWNSLGDHCKKGLVSFEGSILIRSPNISINLSSHQTKPTKNIMCVCVCVRVIFWSRLGGPSVSQIPREFCVSFSKTDFGFSMAKFLSLVQFPIDHLSNPVSFRLWHFLSFS